MLTRRMQVQAVADRLAGMADRTGTKLREFEEPWRTCWQALGKTQGGQQALLQALQAYPDRERNEIVQAILAMAPGRGLPAFQSLADLAADLTPVTWLWRNWVPRGMLSLLGAVPGAGKSFVALDLARRIIGGETWPDGSPIEDGGRPVIYIDAEAVPQLLNERAMAWQMNRRLLYLMLPEANRLIDFSAQMDRDRLVEMCHVITPALIVVDSLSSISSKGENNVDDVRAVLGFLSQVAVDFGTGMILIHHLRKRMPLPLIDELSADDFRGSGHIIAMARSVMGLSVVKTEAEQDRNGPRRLQVVKTNLAAYPDALGVEFVPLHPTGVFLRWGAAPQAYEEPTQRDNATDWLLTLLADGPMKASDVVDAAKEQGYSRATVYRAREELKGQVVNTMGRKHRENCWALAGTVDDVAGE